MIDKLNGREITVLVLRGGPSQEREVSLRSGNAVAAACRTLGYNVIESDANVNDSSVLENRVDVVFPVIHGAFGEDGQLQEILEYRGIPYVGTTSHASHVAFNKSLAKSIWKENDIATPDGNLIQAGYNTEEFPDFESYCCKPNSEGSSIGVRFAEGRTKAIKLVDSMLLQYSEVLVEERIFGRELTVGILDEQTLPIVEIAPSEGFYNYDAKYLRNDTEYLVPAPIDGRETESIQGLALQGFQLLGCRHYGRVDVLLDPDRGPFLLEVNTVPGFTATSLLPKAAIANGIAFEDLVRSLVEIALFRN